MYIYYVITWCINVTSLFKTGYFLNLELKIRY